MRKNSAMVARVTREAEMLAREPPPGVCAWTRDDRIDQLLAQIVGAPETPFRDGIFLLEVSVPDRYPFEPPKVRFLTPIYHPNIDSGGRICLDTLKMPPKGSWTPSLNLSTLLTTVRLLMSRPNPDDGLVLEITEQYKNNYAAWEAKAREMTLTHATAERNAALQSNLGGGAKDADVAGAAAPEADLGAAANGAAVSGAATPGAAAAPAVSSDCTSLSSATAAAAPSVSADRSGSTSEPENGAKSTASAEHTAAAAAAPTMTSITAAPEKAPSRLKKRLKVAR